MKKSSGTPTRIRGHISPRKKPAPDFKWGAYKYDKKRSRKWLLLLLLLLFVGGLIFVIHNIPSKREENRIQAARQKVDASVERQNVMSADTKRPTKNKLKGRRNLITKKDAPRRNIRIAIPAEKKENDFGTTLHLDPPPVRN